MHTKTDVKDLRIERVLPYLANIQGATLDELLIDIDNKLKDASPEASSPGLINWSNKHLFVDKWVKTSGTGTLAYNQFQQSKIGKGRFEISGTGIWEYDRFLPVSDSRGCTGKIYLGATTPGTTVSVGVNCYDEDKVPLGNNGGFLLENVSVDAINSYEFYKDTAFGESVSGLKNLKQGTRFVKLFIQVSTNLSTFYFDESELTTFELDERYKQIFTNLVDWNEAEMFYTEVSVNTNFSFKNDHNGRVRTVFIKNTGAGNIEVDFPGALWQGGLPLQLIRPGKTSGFTFIKAGGAVYASVIEEFE